MKHLLSLVIPVFNEAGNIALLYERLMTILQGLEDCAYEIIFVNDGSSDISLLLIENLARANSSVKALSLSRNFGHQAALTAAYDCAKGDIIISMDADLQDPPELIIAMIEKWHQGAHIVYARRHERNDSLVKKFSALAYYLFLSCVSTVSIPRNVGDFRLIDRKVLEVVSPL